jgi:hypothetical protein
MRLQVFLDHLLRIWKVLVIRISLLSGCQLPSSGTRRVVKDTRYSVLIRLCYPRSLASPAKVNVGIEKEHTTRVTNDFFLIFILHSRWCSLTTNSFVLSFYENVDSYSCRQEIPSFYGTWKLIPMSTKSHRGISLSASIIQSSGHAGFYNIHFNVTSGSQFFSSRIFRLLEHSVTFFFLRRSILSTAHNHLPGEPPIVGRAPLLIHCN